MSIGRHASTLAKIDVQFFVVLASPHLPSFIPLVSAMPAYEYMLARRAPHILNGSHEAWYRIIVSRRQ
jgi:hypothetical protein